MLTNPTEIKIKAGHSMNLKRLERFVNGAIKFKKAIEKVTFRRHFQVLVWQHIPIPTSWLERSYPSDISIFFLNLSWPQFKNLYQFVTMKV